MSTSNSAAETLPLLRRARSRSSRLTTSVGSPGGSSGSSGRSSSCVRTDPLSRRRREELIFPRGRLRRCARRSSSRRRGTCPRRSGTCASCTSCPASSPAAAASTGALRPASVVSSESRAMGRRPADRVRVLAAAVRVKGALRGGVAAGLRLVFREPPARLRRPQFGLVVCEEAAARAVGALIAVDADARLVPACVDSRPVSSPRRTRDPCCRCCSKGSALASPDRGWVWVSEKAAKSAGRDATRSSSSAAGAGASSLRGSAARGSGRGASDLDSCAGSGCSGVPAGAEPSVVAADASHIRGSRSANLPQLKGRPSCTRYVSRRSVFS